MRHSTPGRKTTLRQLSKKIGELLPKRQKVVEMQTNVTSSKAAGTIKIYCSADKKTFLSDFEALLATDGGIRELYIDGKKVQGLESCL